MKEGNIKNWLPEKFSFENFDNIESYIEKLYLVFLQDFVDSENFFHQKKLVCKKHPEIHKKSATFWHLISESVSSGIEAERVPNMERCEKLPWIKPIIQNFSQLRVWKNSRSTKKGLKERFCIALEDFSYLVILEERETFCLLWTAYPVEKYRRKKLQKEYEAFIYKQGASL